MDGSTFFVHFCFSIEPWILKVAPGTYLGIIIMEGLRKVIFTLAQPGLSIMDYGDEAEEKLKEREGFFHKLGDSPIWNPEENKWIERTVGIVEEVATGKVHTVYPEMITFVEH